MSDAIQTRIETISGKLCTVAYIPLTKGKKAIVDAEDYEFLSQWKWHTKKNGNTYYAARREMINGKPVTLAMHRILNRTPDGMETDHINRDSLDNRKANLRTATRQQNNINIAKKSKSGYRGVSRQNVGWQATIFRNNKAVYLGYFRSAKDAALRYDEEAIKLHGEFAILNFPATDTNGNRLEVAIEGE